MDEQNVLFGLLELVLSAVEERAEELEFVHTQLFQITASRPCLRQTRDF